MENSSDFVVHCFFEQSGTFKNEFKKLGYKSFDYDILNDFGETDYKLNLFDEIINAFNGYSSVFDSILPDDLIIAFFPCVRFSAQAHMLFQCTANQLKYLPDIDKLFKVMDFHHELSVLYELFCKLCIVCLARGLRLIIENPFAREHYLTRYFPLKPKIVDFDRRLRGDDFKKPTQYWFLNCEPKFCFLPEAYVLGGGKTIVSASSSVERSLINPVYAERFIKEFIL